ncbi:hypothetical protein ACG3SL_11810 [Sphingomonas sp. CJ20]
MKATAIGAAAGLLAALLLAPATGDALGRLATLRAHRDALAAEAAHPRPVAPVVVEGLAIPASDVAAAQGAIIARVQRLARAGGVLVEAAAPMAGPAPLAMVKLRVSGSEKAVLAFADALERERPLMRLRSWRIEPVAGGARLSGQVVGAWQ